MGSDVSFLPAPVVAFDAVASAFDERYGSWKSVACQRRAVRRLMSRAFAPGSRLLELAGGTGEDAIYLAERGCRVHLTDGAPAMVARAACKVRASSVQDLISVDHLLLEDVEAWAAEQAAASFDGAYSNFAAFNCVDDLRSVFRGLARVVAPGGAVVVVVFGPLAPGEILVELLRGRPASALRRRRRGEVPARLGGADFTVRYPRPRTLAHTASPWFRLERTRGIGVFVPPSGAEPEISRHPGLLRLLEFLDGVAWTPLAILGDHVALQFRRGDVAAPAARETRA